MLCARTATAIAPLYGGNLKSVIRARQGIRTPTTCLEGTGAAVTPASRDGPKYTHFEIKTACYQVARSHYPGRVPNAIVNAVGINYDVVGASGPWVLLIQGGRQDMELFRPLAEHFAAGGYRVILHDRRNSGGSDVAIGGDGAEEEIFADDAYALCAQLDALPVIACGGAGGSRHSILLTLRHPGSMRRLLLWWPSGGRPAAEQLAEQYYGQFITVAQAGGMTAVIETPYYAERCARVPGNRERLLQMDVAEFVATMRRWRQFFLDGADLPVIGVDSDTLRTIDVPTCIVPGHDLIHPRHIGQALAGILPNAELQEVPPLEPPAPSSASATTSIANEATRHRARLEHQRNLAGVFLAFLARHGDAT